MAHRRDQDPERQAAIRLAVVAAGFIAVLGLMYWVLFA